jgi:hypothetical protein
MKKMITLVFVVLLSLPLFGKLTEKQVVGKWKYTVETGESQLTGIVKLTDNDGKLSGEVITDQNDVFKLSKIELQENNVLYFELQPDYEVLKVKVTIDGNTFKGKVGTQQGDFEIKGKKE